MERVKVTKEAVYFNGARLDPNDYNTTAKILGNALKVYEVAKKNPDFSIADVAEIFQLNPNYMRWIFNLLKATGILIEEGLEREKKARARRRRLLEAEELEFIRSQLRENPLTSIKTIAEALGHKQEVVSDILKREGITNEVRHEINEDLKIMRGPDERDDEYLFYIQLKKLPGVSFRGEYFKRYREIFARKKKAEQRRANLEAERRGVCADFPEWDEIIKFGVKGG